MLSHAQTDRSQVISYHLRDIGGYRSTVGYICYLGKITMGYNLSGDQAGFHMQWCWVGYVDPVYVD